VLNPDPAASTADVVATALTAMGDAMTQVIPVDSDNPTAAQQVGANSLAGSIDALVLGTAGTNDEEDTVVYNAVIALLDIAEADGYLK